MVQKALILQDEGFTSGGHPAAYVVWLISPPHWSDLAPWPFIAKMQSDIRTLHTSCWNQEHYPSYSNESVLMTHPCERLIVCLLLLRQGQMKLKPCCMSKSIESVCFPYHRVSIWIFHNQIIQKWLITWPCLTGIRLSTKVPTGSMIWTLNPIIYIYYWIPISTMRSISLRQYTMLHYNMLGYITLVFFPSPFYTIA